MKKGIRYHRFSHDGQSHSSIERQDMYTAQWFERNQVELTDTFVDAGYSARTFDRPDFNKLKAFIAKHHRQVDYLVVDQMDRFSRDAGEALSLIKKLQLQYSIQIVSATEGLIFDYHTPGSFFRTGLQFLLAEEDNINRTQKINAGIYTAKAREGRYIHNKPPFGYKKEGSGKAAHLVPLEDQAHVVRYIYEAYLCNTPFYIIKERARILGFTATGNSAITDVLQNPIYSGQQYVKSWKDLPGGVFPANHDAIIDLLTWQRVQEKLKAVPKTKISVSEEMPLRGVLKCHCTRLLTGAPSRGRHGKYFYYYKCQTSAHNNISAISAHKQLHEALGYMSLPDRFAIAIKEKSISLLEERMKEHKKLLQQKKREMDDAEKTLASVEEKWIRNQMSFETYNRWYSDLTGKRATLRAQMEKLSRGENELYLVLQENFLLLTDMQAVYKGATTLQKQELLRLVFDNRLYYKDQVYRTPFLMPIFTHNALILNQKRLLVIDGSGENSGKVEATGFLSNPFTDFLYFIRTIRVA